MGGFGPEKLGMILLIVLVLFGAKRIPEIGGSIGKGIREFKKGVSDLGHSTREPLDEPLPPANTARSLAVRPPDAPRVDDTEERAPKRLLD